MFLPVWSIFHWKTKRRLCLNLYEDKLNIRHQVTNKSAIAKYCRENDYAFNFDSAKSICRPKCTFELKIFEAFHVHRNQNNAVNCDFANPPLSDCWKSYISSNFS